MNKKPQIEILKTAEFNPIVADEIVASINDVLAVKGSCSLALSGGKTPAGVYRLLGLPPRVGEVDWSKLKVFLGDERWVPITDGQSNYNLAHETLLSNLPSPGPAVFPVRTDLASPQLAATDYAKTLAREVANNSAGMVALDLVLLGVGEDGHTASLFPFADALKLTDQVCVATQCPAGQARISLSLAALKAAGKVIFMVKGENKAEIIAKIFKGREDIEAVPAMFYKEVENVVWFLDSASGHSLNI